MDYRPFAGLSAIWNKPKSRYRRIKLNRGVLSSPRVR